MTVTSLTFFHLPQGDVPMVYASSDDPHALGVLTARDVFGTDQLPGYFIYLTETSGSPVDVIGNCAIVQTGLAWNPFESKAPIPTPGD